MAKRRALSKKSCPAVSCSAASSATSGSLMFMIRKSELTSEQGSKNRCLLALHAHPDDESSKGAGTMALYASDGVRVVLLCATRGEEGDILNPTMDQPGIKERMPELREAELQTACDLLGVERIYQLGYRDSGMPGTDSNKHPEAFASADVDEAVGRIVEIIRRERPEVVLCYDESKGYDHPDHVRVHEWVHTRLFRSGRPGPLSGAGRGVAAIQALLLTTSPTALHEVARGRAGRGRREPLRRVARGVEDERLRRAHGDRPNRCFGLHRAA